jgi:hypothetical protein
MDGHAAWKSSAYLSTPANQDEWLLGSDLADQQVWTP